MKHSSKNRRLLGLTVFVLSFCFPALGGSSPNRFAAPGQERPNLLFLFSDDQTFRALGILHELEVKTPNLDRLAKRGLLFTHCFNQGGFSGAVCIPSRTMLNTGRTVWQCRDPKATNAVSIAEGAALWGETLGRAGYNTFMAGKWHIPESALARSFQTIGPLTGGFLPSTPENGPAYRRPAPGNPWTPDDPRWKGHWLTTNRQTVHSSVLIADAAIDFLKTNAALSAKPFFMYVAFNAPHDPRQSPKEFLDLYPPSKLKVPPNFLPKHPFPIENIGYKGRDEILAPYPRTPEIIQVHLQEYYALITHLDAQIGRVLEALDTSGKASNTIIIFTSDQGLAVGQHGLLGKQNLYEHSIRMPFILAGPGIPLGKRNDALFYMQSLFATTCEMAGVPVPDSVQFPSIVPLITGSKTTLYDALYEAFLDCQRAIRTERWELILTPKQGQVQLFDVRKDRWETHNLASDPKHAQTVNTLETRLRELMIEMKDPMRPAQLSSAIITPHADEIARGEAFLTNLLDPELDLLPEFPGAKVYWLFHDNYLAAKILARTHPETANKIIAALDREGVRSSGKIELLFGEAPNPLPFRHYELKEVRRAGEKIIRTEVVTDKRMEGWQEYADLLLLASIAEKNRITAREHWDAAIRMWDAQGFLDAAARHSHAYASYKLALAIIAANRLTPRPPLPSGLLEKLLAMQSNSGGWITDYDSSGKSIGRANVETTSVALLALETQPL